MQLIWASKILFIFILTNLLQFPHFIDARCSELHTYISCINDYPNDDLLNKQTNTVSVNIRNLKSHLTTNRSYNTNSAKIESLQIYRSTIFSIMPEFFAKISNKGLKHLSLTHVNGSFELNRAVLFGLENTLTDLIISDYKLNSIDNFVDLYKLKILKLARTNLKILPTNFRDLLLHLEILSLLENELTTMPWSELAQVVKTEQFTKAELGKNLWHCDCQLKPLIELRYDLKAKIYQFECTTPPRLAKRTLHELTIDDVCPKLDENIDNSLIQTKSDLDNQILNNKKEIDINHSSSTKIKSEEYKNIQINQNEPDSNIEQMNSNKNSNLNELSSQNEQDLAVAGNLSPEIITVIVAAIIAVLVVLVAVIVYQVRKRSHEKRQEERNRGASHKTNPYCAVIEHHPQSSRGYNEKSQSYNNNNSSRILIPPEREPLAPDHRNYRDRKL